MKELESYSYFEELNNDKLFSFVTNKNMNINYAKQSRDEIRDILSSVKEYDYKKIISPK